MAQVSYNEKLYKSGSEFCNIFGIPNSTFYKDLKKGRSIDEIVKLRCTKVEAIKEPEDEVEEYEDFNEDGEVNNYSSIDYENFPELRTQIVTSIPMLIGVIERLNPSRINLIDFENIVGTSSKNLIDGVLVDNDSLNIFVFNSLLYSHNFYSSIKNSTTYNLQLLSFKAANQLVDNLIIFYLGIITSHFPCKTYTIISNDTGYNSLIETLGMKNISIINGNWNSDAATRYKISLASYMKNQTKLGDGSCTYRENILNNFNGFIKNGSRKKSRYKAEEDLIDSLCDFKFIVPHYDEFNDNEVSYYEINMKEVEKALER